MWPRCHRNGSVVGTPVAAFAVALVYDWPVIWPLALSVVLTASGPPRVPRSRIMPCCQMNERAWVPQPNMEYGSAVPFEANPDTWPRSLMSLAWLSYPPGRVPRLITRPFLKMTALSAGQPVLGSVAAVPPGEGVHQVGVGEADHERVEVGVAGIVNGGVGRAEQLTRSGQRDGRQVEKALRAAERPGVDQGVRVLTVGVRGDREGQRGQHYGRDQRGEPHFHVMVLSVAELHPVEPEPEAFQDGFNGVSARPASQHPCLGGHFGRGPSGPSAD